ncbi:MAG: hypothetical protein MJE66_25730, partial [Proteobacteria bacterium]|nr:hypothetical protein [Pseudomonadota bacterium]
MLWLSLAAVGLAAYTVATLAGGVRVVDAIRPSLLSLTGTTSTGVALRSMMGAPVRFLNALLADHEIETLQ